MKWNCFGFLGTLFNEIWQLYWISIILRGGGRVGEKKNPKKKASKKPWKLCNIVASLNGDQLIKHIQDMKNQSIKAGSRFQTAESKGTF